MSQAPSHLKDLWSNSQVYRSEYQTDVETIVDLLDLSAAQSLVDVGCGNGAFSIAAARAYPDLKIFAYDALSSAIDAFNAAAIDLPRQQVTSGVAPAEHLPLADASANRALCRAVLHHIADPSLFYAEVARVLQPGGILLLQAPCNFWQPEWSQFMTDFHMSMDDSHPRQYHTPAQVIAGLNKAGLSMFRADCWTYPWNDVSPEQLALIHKHNAAKRLNLRQTSSTQWAVDFYWVRILARKLH